MYINESCIYIACRKFLQTSLNTNNRVAYSRIPIFEIKTMNCFNVKLEILMYATIYVYSIIWLENVSLLLEVHTFVYLQLSNLRANFAAALFACNLFSPNPDT